MSIPGYDYIVPAAGVPAEYIGAPILPPPPIAYALGGGLDDYSRRFVGASHTAGAGVTTWKDLGPAALNLTKDPASAGTATATAMDDAGKTFVRLRSTAGAITLADNSGKAGMVTLALAVRLDALTSADSFTYATFNGAKLHRLHATGSRLTSLSPLAGFISGGGINGWSVVFADVITPTYRINGSPYATVSGTWDRQTSVNKLALSAPYSDGTDAERTLDVLEVIAWDRALTTTEKTAVRDALKSRYPQLT